MKTSHSHNFIPYLVFTLSCEDDCLAVGRCATFPKEQLEHMLTVLLHNSYSRHATIKYIKSKKRISKLSRGIIQIVFCIKINIFLQMFSQGLITEGLGELDRYSVKLNRKSNILLYAYLPYLIVSITLLLLLQLHIREHFNCVCLINQYIVLVLVLLQLQCILHIFQNYYYFLVF